MFNNILIFGMILILILFWVSFSISNFNFYYSKWNQFECGFKKVSKTFPNFSSQFFMVGVLFLIFDAEIVLLIPAIFTDPFFSSQTLSLIFFILILTVILFIEWKNGMISWAK